jgi:hypothetical protein
MVDGIVNVTCYYDGYSCGDSYERLTLMSEYVGPTHTCLPCPAFNLTGTSYIPNCSYRIDLGSRVAPQTIAISVLVSVIVVVAVVIIVVVIWMLRRRQGALLRDNMMDTSGQGDGDM